MMNTLCLAVGMGAWLKASLLIVVLLTLAWGGRAFALSGHVNVPILADDIPPVFPVAAGVVLYNGALAGTNPAGYAKPFVPGDLFVGVTEGGVSNAGGSAGDKRVNCVLGKPMVFALTGVVQKDIGRPVFATADDALSFSGHPDAYVGTVIGVNATNQALVRLKRSGERPPNGVGSIDINIDFAQIAHAAVDETAAAYASSLKYNCAGAGLTAGTTGILRDEAASELKLLIDNDNEAENITVETPQVFNVTKGVTFECEGRLSAAGGAATDDVDFGLAGLTGNLTTTERANMDAATAGLKSAKFHLDANANDIFFSSDDDAAPVAATDTTVDNVLITNKQFKIIVRPTGAVELWIDGVRYLTATAFSVSNSGLLCGFVNIEKSTGTGVPELRIRRLRVAGAFA